MASEQDFGLRLRFAGSSVEKEGLDLYDGATSFYGFAKALQVVAHAYLNDEITTRATALRGASFAFGSPRRGSVRFDITARFTRSPKTAPLNADTFYDFTRVALARATGNLDAAAQTSFVDRKLTADEPFFDELAEKIEGSLQQAHRAIDRGKMVIALERPRSTLLVFDKETSAWVNTRDEDPKVREFTGNVTRYNTQTGNGRAFIKEVGRIIPVRKSDHFNQRSRGWLTWSLHGDNTSTPKDLVFVGRKIESARGDTKRLILDNCRKLEN